MTQTDQQYTQILVPSTAFKKQDSEGNDIRMNTQGFDEGTDKNS